MPGVVEIELGAGDGGGRRGPPRRQLIHRGALRVPVALRNDVGLYQRLGAGGVLLRQLVVGFDALELGPRAGEGRLVRPGVDDEEQVALLHQVAFVERGADEVPGCARADLHRFGRLGAAGVLAVVGDRGHDRLGDGHLGTRVDCGGGLASTSASPGGAERHHEREDGLKRSIHRVLPAPCYVNVTVRATEAQTSDARAAIVIRPRRCSTARSTSSNVCPSRSFIAQLTSQRGSGARACCANKPPGSSAR